VAAYRPAQASPPTGLAGERGSNVVSMAECLERARDADALVSFVTLPLGDDPGRMPPLYLVDSLGSGYWMAAMKAGIVRAAVTPRMQLGQPRSRRKEADPEERFNAVYQLITPANMADFKTPLDQFRAVRQEAPSP
jgi:hypothetical protein